MQAQFSAGVRETSPRSSPERTKKMMFTVTQEYFCCFIFTGRPYYSQESMAPSSSARRQPAPFRRSATVPAHIIQNTLEKGTY